MKRRLFPLVLVLSLLLSFPVNAQEEETAPADEPLFQTVYVTTPGEMIYFDSEDFQLLCRQATGHDLESLTFSSLPPQAGTFWYRPEEPDQYLQLVPGVVLFPYRKPTLFHTYFRPSSKFTGQAEIPFVMTSVKEESVTGVLHLCVSSTPEEQAPLDITEEHATAGLGQVVSLESLYPFFTPDWPGTGTRTDSGSGTHAVNSVTFSLPPSEEGALWMNYGEPNARKLLPGEVLFPDALPNFYELSFVPAHKQADTVSLSYTVASDGGKRYTGALTLHFVDSTLPTRPPAPTPEPSPVSFSDLGGWAWAEPSVQSLASRFALRTELDIPIFRPGDQATRMEVLHTLVQAAYPNNFDPGVTSFPDLPQDSQYARSAAFAFARGLALGDGAGRLNPDDPITRQDALVLLYRALLDQNRELPAPGDLSQFSDQDALAPYAREAVGVLLSAGILQGDEAHQLQPRSPITRAEMAVLICRAFPG